MQYQDLISCYKPNNEKEKTMEKNELVKTGKNLLEDLVRNDRLEGLPKAAAYAGLALLELAKLVANAKQANKQL